MKALILLLTAPVMGIFSLAGLQTIEWWVETGEGSITGAIFLLILVVLWACMASRVKDTDFDKALKIFESWINKFSDK